MKHVVALLTLAMLAACASPGDRTSSATAPASFVTTASDGVQVHGHAYYGILPDDSPLMLLFHQGGSSARGEYAPIAGMLNGLGYRAIAWDLRSGGNLFDVPNLTANGLPENVDADFCSAYRDVEAALDFATGELGVGEVVVIGSSYSGSLVFQLAARHPDKVTAVAAFSPASGGPMADCRAGLWADRVGAPMIVFRPASEMELESAQAQRDLLTEHGAQFFVADPGTHGASMLVEDRVGGDVEQTAATLAAWLTGLR